MKELGARFLDYCKLTDRYSVTGASQKFTVLSFKWNIYGDIFLIASKIPKAIPWKDLIYDCAMMLLLQPIESKISLGLIV